jgi:hypothetical protein|eukprot:COSAG06_NODE_10709_length_1631_cov_1.708225_2_plen_56_part_00
MDPLQIDFPVFASGWSPSTRSVVFGGGGGPGNSGVKNKLVSQPPPTPLTAPSALR